MQIIIDISEKDYERIRDCEDVFESLTSRAYRAIRNGVSLPKGHGRLIDADKIGRLNSTGDYTSFHFDELIEKAPTIIEADNGRENK